MSRHSPGEGSIYQRSDGKWCGALQLSGKRKVVYGKTRPEVAEKLRTIQSQGHTAGRLPDAGRQTLADYLADWLRHAEGRLRPKTHDEYWTVARVHLLPHLGSVKLAKLQPLHLVRLYATLQRAGVSGHRAQKVHGLLHKVLSDAHRWGLLGSNPAALVDTPKREHRERTLWDPGETSAFLRAAQEGKCGQYGPLLAFLLASGSRVAEALGLRWTDVDWNAGTVRIERQTTELKCRPIESAPKTRAGIRSIVLPSWGMEALYRQKAQVATWRLRAGGDWPGGERVFPSEVGTVPLQGSVRRALHEACERHGLPRIRVHDLRHLHLSMLAMAGVPVKVAQARAGHATAAITMRVYQHIIGDPDRQAAESLEACATNR